MPGHAGGDSAAQRADEYAANLTLIQQLTAQRNRLDWRLAPLRTELLALLDRERRCRADRATCPPLPPERSQMPMVGMAPGHGPPSVPAVSAAELVQQRQAIARLREEIRSRTDLIARMERRIATLRGQ